MAERWYDRPMWDRGLSAKDAAVATAAIAGPPIVLGGALGYAEGRMSGGKPVARARTKQTAPRYRDGKVSPRTVLRAARLEISSAKQNPIHAELRGITPTMVDDAEKKVGRIKASAKATATKVRNGTIQPFAATRVGGRFASSTQRLAHQAGRIAGVAGKTLGVVGTVATVGALGVVAYNMATGKHAADREEAMKRDNDPGRLATSGIVSTAATGLANRAIGGIAARTVAGVAARAAGPLAVGALAGYGAYKGYADEGVKGAVRGAASSLTMGLADKQIEKVLGPKKTNSRPFGPLQIPHIFGQRSEGFSKANAAHHAGNHDRNDSRDYKDTWQDSRGRSYTRRDMSVRKA